MSVRRLGRYAHPPNYCLHSFVWCVWVRTARPCISCLPWLCFCLAGLGLVISCCLPPEAAGFFLLLLLFPGFGVVVASSLVCSGGLGACGVTCSFLSSPFSPLWLSSGAFWSSQSCWSLPPDILLYLRRSGCHTFDMACRGYWLVSSLRFMATKASALCEALPSPPCCGCCSCAPRCGAEVFALG